MDKIFNNPNLYPTPSDIIEKMLDGITLQGKTILEPSAGTGRIVDFCAGAGASVLACEIHPDLRVILAGKCNLIGDDFLKVTSEQISHIDLIVMNPPFNADEKHILHAFNIAPTGCKIISLCNLNTVNFHEFGGTKRGAYPNKRQEELGVIIQSYGHWESLGKAFAEAEHKTGVEVAMITLQKSGASYKAEFEGFFMEEEPEQAEGQQSGLMSYNFIRDLVHRYITGVKIYDEVLEVECRLSAATSLFYSGKLSYSVSENETPKTRNEFKKSLQKDAWKFIFNKMNMEKHTTRGLREDINTFIEKQSEIPFTMKNIFRMLEIVIGTTEQRMDKAILEVFDLVTRHHDENRYNVEGWKTNSHYLLNKRFILPYGTEVGWSGEMRPRSSSNFEMVEDLVKALCYITGDNYSHTISLSKFMSNRYGLTDAKGKYINYPQYDFDVTICERDFESIREWQKKFPNSLIVEHRTEWGKWFDWGYFKVRGYKKGTLHIEFKSEELWARFNQRVAKLKGYPLFEHTKSEDKKKQKEDSQRREDVRTKRTASTVMGKVLFKVKMA